MIAEMIIEINEKINYMCKHFEYFTYEELILAINRRSDLSKLKWVDSLIYAPFNKRCDYLLNIPHTLLKLACDTLGYSVHDRSYLLALLIELPRYHYFNEDNLELSLEILDEASSVFSIYVEDGKIKFFD